MKNNKILLILGASSEIGISLIKKISDQYEIIYAHYCNNNLELNLLKNSLGEKLVLIKSCFGVDLEAKELIDLIINNRIFPNQIVHLASPKTKNLHFRNCNWEDFEEGIFKSIKPIVQILKAFLPLMAKNQYGKVVFMLSSCVLDKPPKFQTQYVTTKYALLGLMKSLSREYADKGVNINGVSPNMIETKFLSEIPKLIIDQNAKSSPLNRNLVIDDVIPAIEYLLSDSSQAVMGTNIEITGGF
jgi:3-oxoacyl-[acyl-carrier protein] reductase